MKLLLPRLCLIILSAVLCVTAIGCNVVRITLNTPLTQNDVAFIVPGQTTLADVIAKLGTPDSITESNMGVVATYRFLDMKYSRINFGWLLKPFSPVDTDMIISRTGFGTDAFELLCDSNWVVTHQSFLRRLSGPRFNPYPF
jgi:sulfur carrier protein ThiS